MLRKLRGEIKVSVYGPDEGVLRTLLPPHESWLFRTLQWMLLPRAIRREYAEIEHKRRRTLRVMFAAAQHDPEALTSEQKEETRRVGIHAQIAEWNFGSSVREYFSDRPQEATPK